MLSAANKPLMLNVIMLTAIMLSAVMLNVVAPIIKVYYKQYAMIIVFTTRAIILSTHLKVLYY